MQTFVCTHETSHVGTNMAHRVLNSSTQENVHLIIPRPAGRREEIELVGLTWVCLQLNCCCDSQSNYTYNMWFSSRPRSPVKHSVLCKYNTYYAIKQLGATSRFACSKNGIHPFSCQREGKRLDTVVGR